MRWLLSCAVVIGLSAADARAVRPAAGGADIVRTIVGTAFVDLRHQNGADVQYRVNVNATLDSEDGFQGTLASRISRGDQGSLTMLSRVTCGVVWGNSAWIGSVVTHSTNEGVLAVGDQVITYVRDFGDSGDILHMETAKHLLLATFDVDGDGDVDCQDRPALFPSTIDTGNLTIK